MTGLISLVLLGLLIAYIVLRPSRYSEQSPGKGVPIHILVLGDIGRSPRMTYHALSIAKHGGKVNLIGYLETDPHPDLVANPSVTLTPLPAPPTRPPSVPFLLFAPVKVIYQILHLTYLLLYLLPPSAWLLVQNPPSIPTLAVAGLSCRLRNTKLIIDWHNYGWTILSSTKGPSHPFVKLSKIYETYLGRLGSHHLTVTHAMARQLRSPPYSIPAHKPMIAVHDRPAAIFQPILSPDAREDALAKALFPFGMEYLHLVLTGRTKLLVSSTSWTPDEDFSLLLEALTIYASQPNAVPILAIITGKGPQKQYYLDKIEALTREGKLPNVTILTAFLSFENYAKLLACADLGVCLHMSSSGVDLPMKVVDMFGAGLPVVAYSGYESFGELIKEGVNGKGFETEKELAGILGGLLSDAGENELKVLKKGAVEEGRRRWDEEWDGTVGKLMGFVSEVSH
ncbi:family 33 putative glycosyltransferase [Triangularia verruculosa]|uniref:Chitobiosyldiphosphodolichol beta-mannosyltransferase n=1 Tax=Triangularia verruculosa TaxID=2587418 RepID=A0AAN7AUV1_9PEZI|nr:family 33 putative glycosyltransferase [Triangularia verruculosa]